MKLADLIKKNNELLGLLSERRAQKIHSYRDQSNEVEQEESYVPYLDREDRDNIAPSLSLEAKRFEAAEKMRNFIRSRIGKNLSVRTSDIPEDIADALDTVYGFSGEVPDFKDKYNTDMSDKDYIEYLEWKKRLPERFSNTTDYDLQGFFMNKEALRRFNENFLLDPEKAHMIDRYKKPNHPTFSAESKWSGVDDHVGGTWAVDYKSYIPSRTNINMVGSRGIMQYLYDRDTVFYSEDNLTDLTANFHLGAIDYALSIKGNEKKEEVPTMQDDGYDYPDIEHE